MPTACRFLSDYKKNLGGTNYEPNSAHDSFNGFTFGGACCLFYYIFSLIMLDAKSRGIKKSKILVIDRYRRTKRWRPAFIFLLVEKLLAMKPAEVEKFLQLKRKIYCLLAVLFVLF